METSLLLSKEDDVIPRGFALQTQLRKGLGKEWSGPCIFGAQQECAGMLRIHMDCLSQKHCSQNSDLGAAVLSSEPFLRRVLFLCSYRIDHTSPEVIYIEEKPEPYFFSLR